MDRNKIAGELLGAARELVGVASDDERAVVTDNLDMLRDVLASLERLADEMSISKERDPVEQMKRQKAIAGLRKAMTSIAAGAKVVNTMFQLGYFSTRKG